MLSNTTSKIGWKASDFALPAVDGRTYSLADVRGQKGTLVVFICNHCPYVKASIGRIVAEAAALREIGVGTIAIMPNDTDAYAEDSFDNMKAFAARHRFTFPYAMDKTQEVARAYDAQCTLDFFGFNARDELQYRGRLDASRMTPVANARRDLFEAMKQVTETGQGPKEQLPSIARSNGGDLRHRLGSLRRDERGQDRHAHLWLISSAQGLAHKVRIHTGRRGCGGQRSDREIAKAEFMNSLSGQGPWMVEATIEEAVAADVINAALFTRFRSRQDHTFGEKMLSAIRFGFGGQVEGIDPEPKLKDAPRRAATQTAASAAGRRRHA